ncbi:hypothetical protein IB279_34265 [Ensifer sp. ENS06]|uniref:hypothetical protein n=1 Tax=Ensifer sp. ENS06 TaxID=2769276 RepID=UPI0017853FE7|nr:hypothetical protein [Ensifer sp. ENS06]MBD9628018.1 hypothetical protein [Ensifer sp. ENS06]
MVFIDIPTPRPRWKASVGPQGGGARLDVLGIEVTQAIQNMNHDVRLIAGKATAIRVYVQPHGLTSNMRVRGEIVISTTSEAPGSYVASVNEISLRARQHPTLAEQRRDAALSLNFVLPSPPVGLMSVRLMRIQPVSGGNDFPIMPGTQNVEFFAAPMLRVRVLGYRYSDPNRNPPQKFAPDAIHFDHLRSYLTRAYPSGGLDWSQTVVDAPPNFVPPFSGPQLPDGFDPLWWALLGTLHQHLLTIRQADIDAGWDPRTHYYGLVSDHSGFFRGASNDVPAAPAPNTIAVGPCGKAGPRFWDDDGSYGDWYGAHELAHTFGRRHPGFCDQSSDDEHFPHLGGAISDSDEDCVGFDVGDASLNLPMRAYPRENWSDFMTYCDRQWVSKYTYDGLLDRLVAEEALFAPQIA